jgi:hypothetical protein
MSEDERIFLKRYLSQYYRAKERQKILRERLADIRTELDPAGKNGRNTSLAIKMAEIEDRIARQSEIEATAILDIMDVLEFLPQDSVEREIMEMRHIDCKPWNEIMRTIHLSRAPCFRRYSTGLEWLYTYKKVRTTLAEFRARVERTERTATKKQRPGHSSGAAHWEFPHREIPAKAPGYAPAFSFPILDFRLTPRTPRIPCPGCRPEILRRVQGFKKAQNHTPGNKAPPVWPCFLPAVKTAPVWRGSKVVRNRGHPAAQPHSTEQRRGAAGSRRGNRRAAKEDTQRDPRSQYNGRMDKGQPAQAHHE